MILVIIRMEVLSEKRMELSQTIASLSGSIRMEKGCQPSSQIEILKEEYHEIEH
jgi:quinol monooxygenase YgiN